MGRNPYPGVDESLAELCDLQLGYPMYQEDIADYCGVSKQAIGRIERIARRKLTLRLRAIGISKTPGFRGIDRRAALKNL